MQAHSLEEAQAQAALYALGAMSAAEHDDFESHLAAGCGICAQELRAFQAVTDELGLATTPVQPRPELRARVLAGLVSENESEGAVIVKGGLRFVRQGRTGWQPGRAAGIYVKGLHHDTERGYITQLVRMDPNTVYPAHRHADVEELYILEGDITVADVRMHAGDYCRADGGTVHRAARSENGCLFIVLYSEQNHIIE